AVLLAHAARQVPFYREAYRKLGAGPDDLRTADDLRRLPVVTKTIIRAAGLEHFTAEDVPACYRIPERTSGSTGEPFEFFLDRGRLPPLLASHLLPDVLHALPPFAR